MNDLVILVNENDEEIGTIPKLEAHEKGLLHRAFSVFIFNTQGELLLQQRASDKYHSAGLWSNTCCSHPKALEPTFLAANRRLKEEMGIETELDFLHSFIYNEQLENGLIEHEFDHIFYGISDELPQINKEEVADYKYVNTTDLLKDIKSNREKYSIWFRISIEKVLDKMKDIKK
jgi:isopentenyl-diphosphate delta-isomerase